MYILVYCDLSRLMVFCDALVGLHITAFALPACPY